MYNIIANFDGGLTTEHPPRAGYDMYVVMAYNTKVNPCIFFFNIYFCTVCKLSILTSSDVNLNNSYYFTFNWMLDLA